MNANDSNPNASNAPDPNATLVRPAEEQARIAASAGGVAVPGFEIEGTLGRGGMGVVYKATQTGLNRVVALKMLIAGQYADPSSRARFLLEAESVAALEHPHIIRVFAFGESGGHPYLAMEYVPGGTLAERVKASGPLPAKAATELVAKLAAAVAHAHSRGVVHRDIKPLNVLLTADGEPRLSDFGLAKVGRSDLSMTGQVLGTPAYMAPEQAAGKVHEVGTPADVYALGAVLYDLLTGRPPFMGDSAAVTLQRVMFAEPERPRKLNPAIPRDLETICLKCLEKAPAKRYPTAQALADDLLRYSRNEPITVRPAGALERGYKWVKRNKVVSGAIAAVSLALLVGAGISLGFGLEANKQAKEAKRKQKDADDAADREKGEAARADREQDTATVARRDAQRNLVKAILGPISAGNHRSPLSFGEVGVFWQLAELRQDETAWMLLEEATRTMRTCEQLECRAEYALHAAIGLDRSRRDAADQLLGSRLKEFRTQEHKGISLAVVIARTDFASPTVSEAAAHILVDACAVVPDELTHLYLARELVSAAQRLERTQAAKLCARVAPRLSHSLAQANAPDETGRRLDFAEGLGAVALQMEPAAAAQTLVESLAKSKDPLIRRYLADILSHVARRMEPAAAAEVCAPVAQLLADALAKKKTAGGRDDPADGLPRVAGPTEAAEAARLLTTELIDELAKPGRSNECCIAAERLAMVAGQMEAAAAAERCAPVAHLLIQALPGYANLYERQILAEGLRALTGGLPSNARDRSQHITILAAGAFATPHNLLPSLPLLHPHFHPQPRPLPPQTLVELLKHPFCVGEARRAVLDALEFTYSRKFKDQWEFVEYAQKHQPQLDLLSPPKRPERP